LYDKSASFRCDGKLYHSPECSITEGAVCPRYTGIRYLYVIIFLHLVIHRDFKIAILMFILVAKIGLMCISMTFQHEFRNMSTQTLDFEPQTVGIRQVGCPRAWPSRWVAHSVIGLCCSSLWLPRQQI